jgi:hypothetical protein
MESSDSASRAVLVEGVRGGVALGACVIVLAVLGLTPSLSWLPEVPLVTVALLLPVVAYALIGRRAGLRSGRLASGALAGALAGAISGGVGGVAFVLFGKSALNVAAGILLGVVVGALVGAAGALLGRRAARV